MQELSLYASAPAPLCNALAREIEACEGHGIRIQGAGVAFRGDLEVAYRTCLWSRVASRVLLMIAQFPAPDADQLYACVARVDWQRHMSELNTLAVDCSTRNARIGHSHFAALRVKDAIVDRFLKSTGTRPSVDVRAPDLRLHLHLRGGEARLYLDLAGEGLHRRGYRLEAGPAPLRETLAAGMLYFADWPQLAGQGQDLLDPMCGSGTLVIEAAMMAAGIAPGLHRDRYGFLGWRGHQPSIWQALLADARSRSSSGSAGAGKLLGRDRDPACVRMAQANAKRAGVDTLVRFEQGEVGHGEGAAPRGGLLVCNPPYGKRLGDDSAGHWRSAMEEGYPGWRVTLMLAADAPAMRGAGRRSMEVRNGALTCRVECVEHAAPCAPELDTTAFANRLSKRINHLERWARRKEVECYRLYDADLPDYAVAVDYYCGEARWLHVAEYEAPSHIDPYLARRRLEAAVSVLSRCTGVAETRIVVKRRQRQRGQDQYQRLHRLEHFIQVHEHGARLLVNLHDFLDTGLFLDHRATRRWIQGHARSARFLNLFSYTASASVHAGLGGASRTLSLDLSATYCDWARRNLALNGLQPERHQVMEVDCLQWLQGQQDDGAYDLIFMDPPTFSNSKKMSADLDIQRDHGVLIRRAMAKLAPGGTLIFSCNRKSFKLDERALGGLRVNDVTRASLDEDFARKPPPHRCYRITMA